MDPQTLAALMAQLGMSAGGIGPAVDPSQPQPNLMNSPVPQGVPGFDLGQLAQVRPDLFQQQAVQFTPPPGSQGAALGGQGTLYPTVMPSMMSGMNPTMDPLSAAVQNSGLMQAQRQMSPQELALFRNGEMGGPQETKALESVQGRQNTGTENADKLQQALALGGMRAQSGTEANQNRIDVQNMKDTAAAGRLDTSGKTQKEIQDMKDKAKRREDQDANDVHLLDQNRKTVDTTQKDLDKLQYDWNTAIRKVGEAAVSPMTKGTPMGDAARAKAVRDYIAANQPEYNKRLGILKNQHQKAMSDYTKIKDDYINRTTKEAADTTAAAADDQIKQGLMSDVASIGKDAVLAKAKMIKDPAMQQKILDLLAGM
jgi:hypothetical protein